jgi:hypothetical protein
MNTASRNADHTGEDPRPEGSGHLTRNVLAFALAAYAIVPLILVALYASGNFYSRMIQWYSMAISLQSVDPGRIAIDDPERDVEILNGFISPALRREGFARKQHERWHENRHWAFRSWDLESLEFTENTADLVFVIHTDTTSEAGTHYRDIRQTTHWEKIGRTWYLDDLKDELVKDIVKPWPGVVKP